MGKQMNPEVGGSYTVVNGVATRIEGTGTADPPDNVAERNRRAREAAQAIEARERAEAEAAAAAEAEEQQPAAAPEDVGGGRKTKAKE